MKLSGDWDKLAKKIDKLATATPQQAGIVLRQCAEEIRGKTVAATPADTGNLRNGWHTEKQGTLQQLVYNNVEYVLKCGA